MNLGSFGKYGGQYVTPEIMPALKELEKAFQEAQSDPNFKIELDTLLREYAGRPSNLYFAENLTKLANGCKIYLKREDLNHTGAHKINNVLGQALLAKRLGKTRLIAETGAGQHGVATATIAALMGFDCTIFMGREDTRRQALNVFRMELLGAKVEHVSVGTQTLADAVDEAFKEWASTLDSTHYLVGSAVGPHPFPYIVREFQKIIGQEIKSQIVVKEGRLPNCIVACVGGGSNAVGAFYEFIEDKDVRLIGIEGAGLGVDTALHAATMTKGVDGQLHGMNTLVIQDDKGRVAPAHSISAGLDYPAVGPEHAHLKEIERAEYVAVTDAQAIEGFKLLSKTEGIIPALESSHAIYHAFNLAKTMGKDEIMVINVSGRGDKDVQQVADYLK